MPAAKIPTMTPIDGDFENKHIVSMLQFSADDVMQIIDEAYLMQQVLELQRGATLLPNHTLVAMMAQDSSRTGGSFAAAMDKLGGRGRVPDIGHSSMNKGEDFYDTATCLATQADVLVIRTAEEGGVEKTIKTLQQHQKLMFDRDEEVWDTRIINAGDGTNEHFTQTLMDLFAIHRHFGNLHGLEITFVGPLNTYRVTNSLAIGASLFGMKVNLVQPKFSPMQSKFVDILEKAGCLGDIATDVRPFLKQSHIIYVARAAVEYAKDEKEEAMMRKFLAKNTITSKLLKAAGDQTIVMHALPRNSEIDRGCDDLWRSYYISQMRGGIPTRMALLAKMFGKSAKETLGQRVKSDRSPVLTSV